MRLQYVVPIAALLLSCTEDGRQDPWTSTTVVDSAGVTIVRNAAPQFESLVLRESLRIGRVDGDGPDLFSGVIPVALDSAGNIYVGNRGSTSVRVFSHDGHFLSEFGGRGEGPAEITSLDRVIVGRDTVVMLDFQRRIKVVLFTPAGEFIDSRVIPTVDRVRLVPIIQAAPGWIWARVAETIPSIPPSGALDLIASWVVSGFDAPEVATTVYEAASTTFYGTPSGPSTGLFSQSMAIAFDGAGRMYATSRSAYNIDVSQNERLVRRIRRDVEVRRITRQDVEQLRAEAIGVIDTMSRMPDGIRAGERRSIGERHDEKAALPVPATVAPLQQILVSTDGSFWVEREPESLARWEAEQMFNRGGVPSLPSTWDVFDREGRLVGSVVVPARFRADAVTARSVVGVFADEYDVEFVVRYDVVESRVRQADAPRQDVTGQGAVTAHNWRLPLRHPASMTCPALPTCKTQRSVVMTDACSNTLPKTHRLARRKIELALPQKVGRRVTRLRRASAITTRYAKVDSDMLVGSYKCPT